jgi:hypothetical protein
MLKYNIKINGRICPVCYNLITTIENVKTNINEYSKPIQFFM